MMLNPKNRIGIAVLDRLRKAISNSEDFFILVIVPVIPSSKVSGATGVNARIILAWQYATLSR